MVLRHSVCARPAARAEVERKQRHQGSLATSAASLRLHAGCAALPGV